jgi:hypothetical protein
MTGGFERGRAARTQVVALTVAVLLTAAACGSSSAPGASRATTSSSSATASHTPLPAGNLPSEISKMVCASEAQQKAAAVMGVTAVVKTPVWSEHLYSCQYTYPNGAFTLSVKELSSWQQTLSYFKGLGSKLGRSKTLYELGQGAFQVQDGSVVVRKDWKVLLVDVSGLPSRFGSPSAPRGLVAQGVAELILGCWSGD